MMALAMAAPTWASEPVAIDEVVNESPSPVRIYDDEESTSVWTTSAADQAAAIAAKAADECQAIDDACDDAGPLWIIRGGAVVLRKESPAGRTLFTNFFGTSQLMNAGGFDYGSAGGVDVSAIRRLNDCRSVEFRYFGVDGWNAQQSVTSTGNFFAGGLRLTPLPLLLGEPAGLFGSTTTSIAAASQSSLQSFELNLRRDSYAWLTILGGFRYAEVHDAFAATANVNRPGPLDQAIAVNIDTNNHLYGFQLGGEARLLQRRYVSLEANAKAGIYYNRADVNGSYTRLGFPGFPDLSAADRDDHVAFMGEMSLVGAVRLTNRLSARIGYQLLWIDGVAIATDQPTTLGTTGAINTGGTPFYHGALMNLEYRF